MSNCRFGAKICMLIASAVGTAGCLDIETTTRVKHDGSVERTVVMTGDSLATYEGRYPYTLDEEWQKRIEKIDERRFRLTASRQFSDVDDLNKAIAGEPWRTLQLHATFQTEFEWFFTSYRFSETYLKYNPFDAVPLSDYLTKEEWQLYWQHEVGKEELASHEDSLVVESAARRFQEWMTRNQFEEYLEVFLSGVKKLGDDFLTPASVLERKEELYEASHRSIEGSDFDMLDVIFAQVLRSNVVPAALKANEGGMKDFKSRLEFQQRIFENAYQVRVEMPGLITRTNAQELEENVAVWRNFIGYGFVGDYELWVESRSLNWWFIVMCGLFLFLGLMVAAMWSMRKKRIMVEKEVV